MNDLQNIVADLRAEGDELYGFLRNLQAADWAGVTRFKAWTIDDVVAHLYFGDYLGVTSHRNAQEFLAFMAQVKAAGEPLVTYTRKWLNNASGAPMLERWRRQFTAMCDLFAASDPDLRLTWAGPDMGIKMFTTARLMETWAHSWAIYDLLGVSRPQSDRIRHIATIGTRTYGWSFANRGMEVPGPVPYLELEAPSGTVWQWHEPQEDNRITGSAVEFCQVVTQVRNIADTRLRARGAPAAAWMAIAQCFAGPPEKPPEPGSRGFGKQERRIHST
jgi:uncharacterized protein (TIGR03084 family)